MSLPLGPCHLCGEHKVLTYEHVPAQKAFNLDPVTMFGLENWLARTDGDEMTGGEVLARGGGAFTLCTPVQ